MTPFSLIVSPGITLSVSRSGSPWKRQTGVPARKTETLGCPREGTQKPCPKGATPQSLRLPAPASCPSPSSRHLGNMWHVQRCSLSTCCVLGSLLPSLPTSIPPCGSSHPVPESTLTVPLCPGHDEAAGLACSRQALGLKATGPPSGRGEEEHPLSYLPPQ